MFWKFYSSFPLEQRGSSKRHNGSVNSVSTQNPVLFFSLFILQAVMTDWQVVEGHRSSVSQSPGAQVMARSHPQVLLLLQATAETSPLGCHVSVSMEMRRQAAHGSYSHLYGQWLTVASLRRLPSLTTVAHKLWSLPPKYHWPSLFVVFFDASERTAHGAFLAWQCYPCEACWEQWWDVRLDLQVWAGPKRGGSTKGLPTLSKGHGPLWFYLGVWKYQSQKLSPLRSAHNWLLRLNSLVSPLICVLMSH